MMNYHLQTNHSFGFLYAHVYQTNKIAKINA